MANMNPEGKDHFSEFLNSVVTNPMYPNSSAQQMASAQPTSVLQPPPGQGHLSQDQMLMMLIEKEMMSTEQKQDNPPILRADVGETAHRSITQRQPSEADTSVSHATSSHSHTGNHDQNDERDENKPASPSTLPSSSPPPPKKKRRPNISLGWDVMFQRLKDYKEKYGDCLVPLRYTVDPKLGKWIDTQRRAYREKKMKPDRQELLESVGFVWKTFGQNKDSVTIRYNIQWEKMFKRLQEFKAEHGHCRVPYNYPPDKLLASWIRNQNRDFKAKLMKKWRQERLEELGVLFGGQAREQTNREEWDKMFYRLQQYKEKHGHCNVPRNCNEDETLTRWVKTQRRRHNAGKLPCDREERLESLGFLWFKELKREKEEEAKEEDAKEEEAKEEETKEEETKEEEDGLSEHIQENWQPYDDDDGYVADLSPQQDLPFSPLRAQVEINSKIIRDKEWEEMFERLQHYKQQNGSCLEPNSCNVDKRLGEWVEAQRHANKTKKLAPERQERLESIGFIWDKQGLIRKRIVDKEWDDMFGRLQHYKNQFGDLLQLELVNVDKRLIEWVEKQRMALKLNKITAEKKECLDSVGFVWEKERRDDTIQQPKWNEQHDKDESNDDNSPQRAMSSSRLITSAENIDITAVGQDWLSIFQRLKDYKEKYGDCLVPLRYTADRKLGKWIDTQRRAYREKKMRSARQELLESVGFVWKTFGQNKDSVTIRYNIQWEKMFKRLQEFKAEHGHCQVSFTSQDPQNKQLSRWLQNQNRDFKAKLMKKWRQERLEELGVVFGRDGREQNKKWEKMFYRLQQYKEKHGHCRVLESYAEDKALAKWVGMQRRRHNENKMRYDREERLKSLGFVWGRKMQDKMNDMAEHVQEKRQQCVNDEKNERNTKSGQKWYEMFHRLEAYKEQHGNCIVPCTYDDKKLYDWVRRQRTAYKLDKMKKHRLECLESIGFSWSGKNGKNERNTKRGQKWYEMFHRLEAYKEQHGNCIVPCTYYDKELSIWIKRQRTAYNLGKMKKQRLECLESIGFSWLVNNIRKPKEFDEMFVRLEKFKQEHGHCCVPIVYTADVSLANWAIKQRRIKKKGEMEADKQERLESLGFEWDSNLRWKMTHQSRTEAKWNEIFQKLQKYKELHGDCLVPSRHADKEVSELGQWALEQRRLYKVEKLKVDRQERLESIGFEWHETCSSMKWNKMFQRLKDYKEQHGHCLVPVYYSIDEKLGRWVMTQRSIRRSNALSAERQELLNSIGFSWNNMKRDAGWNEMFQRLSLYKQQYGDCLVPPKYSGDKKLGLWVRKQRQMYRLNMLETDRQGRLESLGFVWQVGHNGLLQSNSTKYSIRWEQMFERLKQYRKETGSCCIPQQYRETGSCRIPHNKIDKSFVGWVDRQRFEYRHKRLRPDREERLRSIGFEWDPLKKDKGWDEMFEILQIYKEQHGHTLVSPEYVSSGKYLGRWLNRQKVLHRKKQLNNDRLERLEAVGVMLNITEQNRSLPKSRIELKWQEMFQRLKLYKQQHGDCLVPSQYDADESLGYWVGTQRNRCKMKKISPDRKALLESIGFDFNACRPEWGDWSGMYLRLQKYKQEHGDCLVPINYALDRELGRWVAYQRRTKRTKILKADRQECLESIGFVWDASSLSKHRLKWDSMFKRLEDYKKEHGDCLVPPNYAKDNALGRWVLKQRQQYRSEEMSTERRERLESLGFVWKKVLSRIELI